jgi:ADP-ribose pyrophosphatase YjhB (NUDIX family)
VRTPHPDDDSAALIINQVIDTDGSTVGYIMIKDSTHPNPIWKLASGRTQAGETPQACAQRENKEETGLDRPLADYQEIESGLEWRGNHWAFLFVVKIPVACISEIDNQDPGNEGEIPHYFTNVDLKVEEYYENVLPQHMTKIRLLETLLESLPA